METQQEKPVETPNEIAGFVGKTYQILNNSQFHKIIFWATNGTEFVIKDINKFQQIVLPKYFRHRNVNSFIRQLNMYGFHKSRKQNTRSVFSHPYFIKNKEHLLCMVRRKIKNLDEAPESEAQAAMDQETSIKSLKSIKSHTDIPVASNAHTRPSIARLEFTSPMKELISTNELIATNINISIKRISFRDMEYCVNFHESDEDDDNVSIEDELERHKSDFTQRVMGLSLINTSIFLQEMREHY